MKGFPYGLANSSCIGRDQLVEEFVCSAEGGHIVWMESFDDLSCEIRDPSARPSANEKYLKEDLKR